MDAGDLDAVLEILSGEDRAVPLETVARALAIPESTLEGWVLRLQSLGVPITRRTGDFLNLEYADRLEAAVIVAGLADMAPPPRVEVRRVCESTNKLAAQGRLPGLCLAELQTQGHGRRGSAWTQPFASGLALSYAVAPPLQRLDGLAVALAVAAVEGLEARGYAGLRLKWPNDLYLGEAKVGGLMVQAEGGASPRLVIGLGINVHAAPRVAGRATAALDEAAGPRMTRNALAVELVHALAGGLERFRCEGFAAFAPRYRRIDLLAGRHVRLRTQEGDVAGVVRGVGDIGDIAIETSAGLCHYAAGEVSLGACPGA